MDILEKDLEDIIFEADLGDLYDRGLDALLDYANNVRQLRIGNYGIADIVQWKYGIDYREIFNGEEFVYDKYVFIEVNVIELKKDLVNSDTFLQAIGYLKGINEAIKLYFRKRKLDYEIHNNITLIGKSVDTNSSFIFLTDFINESEKFSLNIYTYKIKINGLEFKKESRYFIREHGNLDIKSMSYKSSIEKKCE